MKAREISNFIGSGKRTCNPAIYFLMVIFILLCTNLSAIAASGGDKSASKTIKQLKKADKLFKDENWAEAKSAYDKARELEADWHSPRSRLAVEKAVACSVKLQQWDDAVERAEKFIAETKGRFEEAIGKRFLGGLYLTMPHYGTKRGTTFLRGQWTQGVQVHSWRKDRRQAIEQYELARQLLIGLDKDATKDRILNPN